MTLSSIYNSIYDRKEVTLQDNEVSLIFDTITQHQLQLNSNVTENWLENNTIINDCIARQAEQITLTGLIGEVVYVGKKDYGISNIVSPVINKLGKIGGIIPEVDNYTQLAKDVAQKIDDVVDKIDSTVNSVKNFLTGQTPLSKQEKSIGGILYEWWKTNKSLTVKTPWGTFDNMYILSAPIVQENTNTVTNVSITLKHLNFTQTSENAKEEPVLEQTSAIQQAIEENIGQGTLEDMTLSEFQTEEMADYWSLIQ